MRRRGQPGDRILVTGGEEVAALAMVRGLRAGGYRPIAVASRENALALASRDCEDRAVVADPSTDPDRFFVDVVEVATAHGARAVLPGTEAALTVLAEHAAEAPDGLRLGVTPGTAASRATDKRRIAKLAVAAGFATPRTVTVRPPEAYDGPFPVMVKPIRSEVPTPDGRLEHAQVRRADDPDALAAAIRRLAGDEVLVQEVVEGPLRTINGVAWEGEVLAAAHHVAERTWPAGCGTMSSGRTVAAEPALDAATGRLMTALRWSGVFSLDVLEAPDGARHLIDINPRPWFSLALTRAAGLNAVAIWTDLLLGRTPRLPRRLRRARFRAEELDARALLHLARSGAPGRALRGALPRPRTVHAVLSIRDPAPSMHIVHLAKATADRVLVTS